MTSNDKRSLLEKLLDDPIVDLVLARDGWTKRDVLNVFDTVKRNMHPRDVNAAA